MFFFFLLQNDEAASLVPWHHALGLCKKTSHNYKGNWLWFNEGDVSHASSISHTEKRTTENGKSIIKPKDFMTIDLIYVLKQTFYQDIKWCRTWMEMNKFHAGGMWKASIGDADDVKQNENKDK